MRCHEAPALERLADHEVDADQRIRLQRHVAGCALCAADLQRVVDLRARLREDAPYFTAPAETRALVQRALAAHAVDERPAPRTDPRPGPRWATAVPSQGRRGFLLGAGALAGSALTAGGFALYTTVAATARHRDLVDAVVAAQGHASLTGHVLDVRSSDLHTVKPWLSQRLDYAPPVRDFSDDGFVLRGGRLDQIEQVPVATLVYDYGHHRIDVYVRPLTDRSQPFDATVARGFNVVRTEGAGMEWIGVSDLNVARLRELMQRCAAPVQDQTATEPAG